MEFDGPADSPLSARLQSSRRQVVFGPWFLVPPARRTKHQGPRTSFSCTPASRDRTCEVSHKVAFVKVRDVSLLWTCSNLYRASLARWFDARRPSNRSWLRATTAARSGATGAVA